MLKRAPKAAEWRRQRQVIKRALDVIDPVAPRRMKCLHPAIDAVRVIANKTPDKPLGKTKSHLKVVAAALAKARFALANLPDRLGHPLLAALDAPEQRVGDLLGQIDKVGTIKRGGGPEGARLDARRKAAAAVGAFELLCQYGDGFPEGERFHMLASLLFEAATGRHHVDCKNACIACSRSVRRQDAFDKRAWRRKNPTA